MFNSILLKRTSVNVRVRVRPPRWAMKVKFHCIFSILHSREFYSAIGFGILAAAGGSSGGDLVYMSRSFWGILRSTYPHWPEGRDTLHLLFSASVLHGTPSVPWYSCHCYGIFERLWNIHGLTIVVQKYIIKFPSFYVSNVTIIII